MQLAIFIRRVTVAFQVYEEFLQLVSLRSTTTGQDIFDAVLQCMKQHSLHPFHLMCTQLIHKVHCIIHQESLCSKSANLTDVMSVVMKVVNSILSRSLNHRQFQALMDSMMTCFTSVKSAGRVMESCCPACVTCSRSPPSSVKRIFPVLIIFFNPQWFAGLALFTDITTHLNDLNVKLQGKNILVTDMYSHITTFEV